MDEPSNPEILDYNHKKMKKNGYIDVEVKTAVEGVKIGDTVYVSATEFGQLDDDAMITCITTNDKEILMPKRNLELK